MGEHQTKNIIEDIQKEKNATKIDLLEIGITFYFLSMIDQNLNKKHKVGHHKKSPPKKIHKTTIQKCGCWIFLSKTMFEKILLKI